MGAVVRPLEYSRDFSTIQLLKAGLQSILTTITFKATEK